MSKNLSAKYYQENKERLQKKLLKDYQNLSKEEKDKKHQYGRKRYKNLLKDKKEWEKLPYYNYKKLLFETIIMKYILEKQFWSYKFKRKCALEKIAENYKLKNL